MKLFIWDFHGVLEKGNENAVIEISNMVLEEYGYSERFSWGDCEKYYGLKWYEYFEKLLPNEDHTNHMQLQSRCFDISDNNPQILAKHMKQNDFAEQVLSIIDKKHRQILISNTHSNGLKMFLKAAKVDRYFTQSNTFAANAHKDGARRSKTSLLKKFLDNTKENFEEIISIGDSIDDINLVKNYPNSKTFLYSHPYRDHKETEATYKIKDLRDILQEV